MNEGGLYLAPISLYFWGRLFNCLAHIKAAAAVGPGWAVSKTVNLLRASGGYGRADAAFKAVY